MNAIKYKVIWTILLFATIAFGQKHSKKINESFDVNHDVLVEITTRHSNIAVETWNKNKVYIEGFWEIEGMTKEHATNYFKGWKFEALGNKNKVVITSRTSNIYHVHSDVFDDMNFDVSIDFDMESITHIGGMFDGDYYSELPPILVMSPMPPMSPVPPFPAPVIGHLKKMKFDYEAYQKDKEGYMKDFEKRQKAWEKEFEEKFAPQMEAYEKQMEEWQKKMKPQMKAYEEKMKKWEKEIAPQMREYENKMEKKLKQMEKEMEVKYAKKMKEKGAKMNKYNIKKRLVIKVPSGATLKIDSRYGKISLPDNIKTIN